MTINRRVSLRKHADDIRRWTDEGKSDEWMARALGTSASSVQSFRSRNGIYRQYLLTPLVLDDSTEHSVYEGSLERTQGKPAVWFDPAIQDDEAYRKGWLDAERVKLYLTPKRIVVVRV